jgi:hypothetical protein
VSDDGVSAASAARALRTASSAQQNTTKQHGYKKLRILLKQLVEQRRHKPFAETCCNLASGNVSQL